MMTLLGSAEGEEKPRELLIESIFGREGGECEEGGGEQLEEGGSFCRF